MIVHVCFGTTDLAKAGTFYDAIAEALGAARSHATDTAIYWAKPGSGVGFAATLPYDGEPATRGERRLLMVLAQRNHLAEQRRGALGRLELAVADERGFEQDLGLHGGVGRAERDGLQRFGAPIVCF